MHIKEWLSKVDVIFLENCNAVWLFSSEHYHISGLLYHMLIMHGSVAVIRLAYG